MEILGGPLFAVAGAGESHGPAVTSIVFGCPPGVELSRTFIQSYLDRRRPGSSRHGTPRRETDKAIILSGLYSDDHDSLLGPSAMTSMADDVESSALGYETGFTTGEPIAVVVLSTSQRSMTTRNFPALRVRSAPDIRTWSSTTSRAASWTSEAAADPAIARPSRTSSAGLSPVRSCRPTSTRWSSHPSSRSDPCVLNRPFPLF